jgi:hypothetical protein
MVYHRLRSAVDPAIAGRHVERAHFAYAGMK